MQKSKAAAILAGINPNKRPAASAPTNLHVMSGEVVETSEDGQVAIRMPGMFLGDDDEQYIEVDTLGGLEEGDTATIILAGEEGKGMSPMAIGSVGSVDRIVARVVETEHLIAQKADIEDLEVNYAHISEGVIDNAQINHANVQDLAVAYAKIDAANISTETVQNSWINALMVQTGLIAQQGTVYTLDAIQVNASNITAGTIDVERLIVTVNGEKYMVHVDPTTLSPTYEKLDGNVIEDLTITADKIVAGAITADKITTNNISGPGGWINLRNGTFAYVNAITGDGISWDGSHLSIGAASQIGGVTAESVASIADQLQYDHTYTYDSSTETYTFTASVYRAGVDITNSFDDSYFVWYLKNEAGTTLLGHGKTMTVRASDALYTGSVIGGLEDSVDYQIVDNFVTGLVTAGGDEIIARVLAREV